MYKNAKNVGYYMIGKGAVEQIQQVLSPKREAMPDSPAIFFIDHFFLKTSLIEQLPILEWDQRILIDTANEPTCESVDEYTKRAKDFLAGRKACALVAVGGGSTMDTCKCVGNLLTNEGTAADYQGVDLVKNPAPWKLAVPTLSGTGSETSRTGMMINKKKGLKLGMNSDYSVFDQVLLDPAIPASVPPDQYFYTGLDTFIRCFEYLEGASNNAVTDSFAEKALDLTKEIFLADEMMNDKHREKMMIASFKGGMADNLAGLAQTFAAGLSVVLGTHSGLANCLVLQTLADIYPEPCKIFNEMLAKQKIALPKDICKNLTAEQYDQLYAATATQRDQLANKYGDKYKDILTKENIIERYKKI